MRITSERYIGDLGYPIRSHHGISLAQVAPLSLIRLLQKGGERTYNSGVSQAFKGAIFFSIKLLPLGTTSISTALLEMKHIHLLLVAFALSSGSLLAQTTVAVQGSLKKTTDRTPVDFANVLLRHPADSSLVVGTTSDEHGAFRLEAPEGTFLLEVRALGYRPYHQTLTIAGALDLGELLLTEETKQLSAVQVTGRRPIMLRKADRMVFDATQIAPAASSALDVLRQTPGVNVSDGGISLIGKGGVIVLINDKRVRLSGSALISLLRSYPQSDLQEIQILTTPPAKYEAEGNAGVLNLILKKAKNDFFGGSISPRLELKKERTMYSLNTNLNYKNDKVSASLQFGGGRLNYDGYLGTYRTYPKQGTYHASETTHEGASPHFNLNLRAGLDYAFTPEFSVGGNVSYSRNKGNTHRVNDSRDYRILPSGERELLRLLPGVADNTDKSHYTTANVHLEKTFKSAPQRRLSWDADYVGYRSQVGRNFSSRGLKPNGTPIPGSDFHFDALTDQHTDSYITSLDYTEPLGKGKLGFGAKGTWTRTTNRSDYDAKSSMGERHDKITFDEHVYALYADFKHPLSDKWDLRTGLRMEYTHTAGENNGRRLENLRSYLNVFPTLFLGFNPNDRHAFSLNGTVRLNRPHFGQLSPFASYENQYSVMRGKEDLRAAKRAKLALGYTFLGALDFQLDGGYLWDGITQVIRLDPVTNQGSITHDNAEKTWTFGLENSFFFNKVSFFQTYISQRLWYSDMKIGPESTSLYGGAGLTYHVSLNNTFFFNRSKTFQGTCSFYYRTPGYDWGFHAGHIFSGGAGLSYTLLQGKLRVAVDAYNLLRNNLRLDVTTPDYQMNIENENSPFYCSLGVTYSFGAPIQGKSERKSAQELRSRM